MPYAIITEDIEEGSALRARVRDEHLAYLDENKALLLAAGAQVDDDGTGGHGGILIVDTEDRAAAERFIENDPFAKNGLFKSTKVVRWRKAFFNHTRLV